MKQPTPVKKTAPPKNAVKKSVVKETAEQKYRRLLKVKDVTAGKAGANMSSYQRTAANVAAQREQDAAKQAYLAEKAKKK
jgi:hypothetical protein